MHVEWHSLCVQTELMHTDEFNVYATGDLFKYRILEHLMLRLGKSSQRDQNYKQKAQYTFHATFIKSEYYILKAIITEKSKVPRVLPPDLIQKFHLNPEEQAS